MKLAQTPTSLAASPAAPGISSAATGLSIAAGFLLSVLPLLFVRGTQAWFSDAPTVWVYSLGFVVAMASLGILAGEVATRHLPASAARWLQTILLLGAFATMPLLPTREAISPAPVNAALDLLRWLLAECGLVAGALGFFLGGRLAGDPDDNRGTPGLDPGVFQLVDSPDAAELIYEVKFSGQVTAGTKTEIQKGIFGGLVATNSQTNLPAILVLLRVPGKQYTKEFSHAQQLFWKDLAKRVVGQIDDWIIANISTLREGLTAPAKR